VILKDERSNMLYRIVFILLSKTQTGKQKLINKIAGDSALIFDTLVNVNVNAFITERSITL